VFGFGKGLEEDVGAAKEYIRKTYAIRRCRKALAMVSALTMYSVFEMSCVLLSRLIAAPTMLLARSICGEGVFAVGNQEMVSASYALARL